jgi:hypothetical protein
MTVKIHKINKDDLAFVSSILSDLVDTNGMIISHYADSVKGSAATLNFEFEGVEKHLPVINSIEFCNVVRKKVDMRAIGPNQKIIKDNGLDLGEYDYKDSIPSKIPDLPPGFQQLYKG